MVCATHVREDVGKSGNTEEAGEQRSVAPDVLLRKEKKKEQVRVQRVAQGG